MAAVDWLCGQSGGENLFKGRIAIEALVFVDWHNVTCVKGVFGMASGYLLPDYRLDFCKYKGDSQLSQ